MRFCVCVPINQMNEFMRPVSRGTIPPKGQPHTSTMDGHHPNSWLQPLETAPTSSPSRTSVRRFHAPTLTGPAADDDDTMRRGVWPPPSLKAAEAPLSRDTWDDLNVKKSRTPNLSFLVAKGGALNRTHHSRTPSRVEMRLRVMSSTPTVRVPVDVTDVDAIRAKDMLKRFEAPHPAAIEAHLNEDLARIDASDNYRRLHAHRVALERFIALQGASAQSLLKRVLACYEEVELHQFSQHFDDVTKRFQASEVVAREAITERNALRHHAESLRLEILNLERQLHAKEEILAEIATSHRINLTAINWMTGSSEGGADTNADTSAAGRRGHNEAAKKNRSMAEIRTIQERVAARHGEAQRQAAKEDALAMMTEPSSRKESQAEAEHLQREIAAAEQMLSSGISALHGGPPNGGMSASGRSDDNTAESGNDMSELYVSAQRTENLGIVLSPPASGAIETTATHLPGESPRR